MLVKAIKRRDTRVRSGKSLAFRRHVLTSLNIIICCIMLIVFIHWFIKNNNKHNNICGEFSYNLNNDLFFRLPRF